MPTMHAAIASMAALGQSGSMLTHARTCLLICSQHPPLSFLIGSFPCYIACWLILLRASCDFLKQDAWVLIAPLADALSPKGYAQHASEIAITPVPVPYAKACHLKRDAAPPTQPAKGSQGHASTQSVKLTDKGRGRGGGMGRGGVEAGVGISTEPKQETTMWAAWCKVNLLQKVCHTVY